MEHGTGTKVAATQPTQPTPPGQNPDPFEESPNATPEEKPAVTPAVTPTKPGASPDPFEENPDPFEE